MRLRISVFEGLKHVRKLARGGTVSYQYDREVNPKPLRPIAQKLFGKWALVRALHTEADYHRACLDYDEMIRRRREFDQADVVVTYQGPWIDQHIDRAMEAAASMANPNMLARGRPAHTLNIEWPGRQRCPEPPRTRFRRPSSPGKPTAPGPPNRRPSATNVQRWSTTTPGLSATAAPACHSSIRRRLQLEGRHGEWPDRRPVAG